MPRLSPIIAAFSAAFVAPILVVVILGVCALGNPPLALSVVGLIIILASVVIAYIKSARELASGKADLVMDRRQGTMALPQTFGRKEQIVIPLTEFVTI